MAKTGKTIQKHICIKKPPMKISYLRKYKRQFIIEFSRLNRAEELRHSVGPELEAHEAIKE